MNHRLMSASGEIENGKPTVSEPEVRFAEAKGGHPDIIRAAVRLRVVHPLKGVSDALRLRADYSSDSTHSE